MLGDLPVTVGILSSSLFSCKLTKIKKVTILYSDFSVDKVYQDIKSYFFVYWLSVDKVYQDVVRPFVL